MKHAFIGFWNKNELRSFFDSLVVGVLLDTSFQDQIQVALGGAHWDKQALLLFGGILARTGWKIFRTLLAAALKKHPPVLPPVAEVAEAA